LIEEEAIEKRALQLELEEERANTQAKLNAIDDISFDDEDVFELEEVTKHPKALKQVRPKYPHKLEKEKIEGWAVVEWVITSNGKVKRARAVNSSHPEFEATAVEAIIQSKWKSARLDGKSVNTRIRQRLGFTL